MVSEKRRVVKTAWEPAAVIEAERMERARVARRGAVAPRRAIEVGCTDWYIYEEALPVTRPLAVPPCPVCGADRP